MDLELWKAAMAGNISFFNQISRREDLAVYLRQVDHEGNSALHIAAEMGYFVLVVFLCKQNTELLALANNSGDFPLHCAARAGHLRIVAYIDSNIFEPQLTNLVSAVNNLGNTALLEAVQNGQALVVGQLLSVAPATAGTTNRMGISPLYLAAARGSVGMVKLLLDTGIASSEGPKGQNALHAAVVRSLEIAKLIVEPMPDLILQGDAINNSTPLHYAASHADIKMVRFILEANSSAAYLRDNDGFSAIHVAANIGHVNIIRELLRKCPECMKMKDVRGMNFVHIAISKKRSRVVKYVLRSRVLAKLANLPDNDGNTALHHAALSSIDWIIVNRLSKNAEVYESPMNNSGDTPLDLASSLLVNEPNLHMAQLKGCLRRRGSRFSPQRLDLLPEPPLMDNDRMNNFGAAVSSLSTVAILIATVTFAAVFTLPGGYSNGNGTSLRASDPAFKIFIISDTVAMVSSMVATYKLIKTRTSRNYNFILYYTKIALILIRVALAGMTIAFGTNVLVVVKYQWMAAIVCVISFSVCLFTPLGVDLQLF